MVVLPLQFFLSILLGIFALLALTGGTLLVWRMLRQRKVTVITRKPGSFRYRVGTFSERVPQTGPLPLFLAALLVLGGLGGRHAIGLWWPSRPDQGSVVTHPSPRKFRGLSGADLVVEESGTKGRPRLIFTHGWGLDRREWDWARTALSQDFEIITWDLPGLGESTPIPSDEYTLENMAGDLETVLTKTGDTPAVLVGHSIGGMINITFCRLYPQYLGQKVIGVVQLNTTYTNPVKTTTTPGLDQALQKPIYEPLLHAITVLSPIVRMTNWLGYQSGLAHLQSAAQSFAGTETREQLDFAASYNYKSSPGVVARGVLGMLHWDGTNVLPTIPLPVLVIAGKEDKTTVPSASDFMSSRLPRGRKVEMSPAAHLGPIEQHQQYNAAIREFALNLAKSSN